MRTRYFLLLVSVLANSLMTFPKGRILMLDECIDTMSNIRLTFHSPLLNDDKPVLKADKPWEYNANGDPYAAPFSGGVWYDEQDSLYKMWYSAGGGKKHGLITCYAESHNGVDWMKPVLDIVAGTNIVDTLEHDCVTVILDKYEPDKTKRYKMFCVQFDTPSVVSMVLKYSRDGKHWNEPVALSGDLYDRCSAYYDAFRNRYVLSLKTKDSNNLRARNYLGHEDPEMAVSLAHRVYGNKKDKFIKFWFSADEDDPRHPAFPDIHPAIYNHDAIPYESVLLGQFVIWQGPENKDCVRLNVQKRNEILLGYSYDGFRWLRPDKTPFIPVNEDSTAWNAGNIQSTMGSPLIVGDSLHFYYSGRYNSRPKHPSNFATGIAKLRRDGFVSADADESGYVLTKPIKIEHDQLFVNVDLSIKGSKFYVEILDGNHVIIPGFEKRRFNVAKGLNATKYLCTWASDSLSRLKGEKVILKFYIKKGSLYSFWQSDNLAGESGGYTAGGGPGLSPTGVDL